MLALNGYVHRYIHKNLIFKKIYNIFIIKNKILIYDFFFDSSKEKSISIDPNFRVRKVLSNKRVI